jgi:hypothetical protein
VAFLVVACLASFLERLQVPRRILAEAFLEHHMLPLLLHIASLEASPTALLHLHNPIAAVQEHSSCL